jgi:D-threo-aldose 1-dehydrogenase
MVEAMDPLARRRLGRSALELPVLGLGGAPFGDLSSQIGEANALATIEHACALGICYFDTAPWYGCGKSEHRLGHVLRQRPRHDFLVSTKVGRILVRPADPAGYRSPTWAGGLPFEVRFDYSYDGVMRSYEDSLQRLGLNGVDLLVIHDLDLGYHGSRERVAFHLDRLDRGGGWRALAELKAAGEIKAIGAGVNDRGVIPDFVDRFALDFFLVAMPYTLLDQAVLDDEFPRCVERGIGFIVGSVFASGILISGALLAVLMAPAGAFAECASSDVDPAAPMALVLSGGGAKGAYEAGVAAVFIERGLPVRLVAGSSAGALNAAMIASGRADRLEAMWRGVTREQVSSLRLPLFFAGFLPAGSPCSYSMRPRRSLIPRRCASSSAPPSTSRRFRPLPFGCS